MHAAAIVALSRVLVCRGMRAGDACRLAHLSLGVALLRDRAWLGV
jgi:hypothetical protein